MPMPAKKPEDKLGRPNQAQDAKPGFDRVDATDEPEPIIPEPNPQWTFAAVKIWESVLAAPHTLRFAEGVDYAYLWLTCEAVNRLIEGGCRAGQLTAVHGMLRELGMTESMRRQDKILIDRTPPEAAPTPVSQQDAAVKHFRSAA